ncbi:MAG: outer membrane beta-barrel protein [Vicinamibacterales bacterium]
MVLAGLLLFAAQPAWADWFVVPALGVSFASNTNLVDLDLAADRTKTSLGLSLLWLDDGWLGGWLGAEGDLGYVGGAFDGTAAAASDPALVSRSSVTTAMGSLIVAAPLSLTRHSLRPYGAAGFGLIRAANDDFLNVFQFREHLLGLRFGGGAMGMLSDTVGLRWDVSHVRTLKGQGDSSGLSIGSRSLSFWRFSMGVMVRF